MLTENQLYVLFLKHLGVPWSKESPDHPWPSYHPANRFARGRSRIDLVPEISGDKDALRAKSEDCLEVGHGKHHPG